MMRRHYRSLIVLATAFSFSASAADIRITLKRSFIDQFKDRATITDDCLVDKALKQPHPASEDADIHIASRCKTAGLATVVEIMNAAEQPTALDLVHQQEGTGAPIPVTGAWRLWCEHGGTSVQRQGASLQPLTTTNPDHVFEIHPVIRFGDQDVAMTVHDIAGYQEKDPTDAFTTYERTRCRLKKNADKSITIFTTMAGYNYVKFQITLNEDPHPIPDGVQVMAAVSTGDGDLLVNNRRMIGIKGTASGDALSQGHKGDAFTVLGIPRIDLSLVAWRVDHAAENPEALDWDLPYEMVIVAASQQ